ncbi:MAG: hypothetical protein LBI71_10215 [Enterobacteriaceae bacterium]|jgi:hypothetical protein|nr:hypothetical protein [Enterobacteriaceae bacterium]
MRDDLPGENMTYVALNVVRDIAKRQSDKALPAGSLGVLFFPLLNRTLKKAPH